MSTDDDIELRDLVAQTLETSGVLNKIRAQLRASVFLALEDSATKDKKKSPLVNTDLREFLNTNDGQIVIGLIQEFFEFFKMECTQSVFVPETGESINYNYNGREKLSEELGLEKGFAKAPLLLEVVNRCKANTQNDDKSPNSFYSDDNAFPNTSFDPINSKASLINVTVTKEMFGTRDKDNNGRIDKETASELLMDIFPNFRKSLIDRFISEEYQAHGKHFSSELNYEEFCMFYKRLLAICQSVVNHDTSLFVPISSKIQWTKPTSPVDLSTTFSKPTTINENKKEISFSGNHKKSPEVEWVGNGHAKHKTLVDDTIENDDSFFDDPPILSNKSVGKLKSESSNTASRCTAGSEGVSNIFRDTLPSLTSTRNQIPGTDSPLIATLERDFNSKLADLNEDYDEDFQSSEQKTGSEVSIGEEIEEDTSAFGDLLGSTASGISLPGNDNITTDKTVSQVSPSGIDYLESFINDS